METKDIKPQVSEGFLKSIKEYLDKRRQPTSSLLYRMLSKQRA